MSRTQESPITITAGEDVEPYRRVKFNGTAWVYADSGGTDAHQAITIDRIDSGETGAAALPGHPGTIMMEASGAISAGAAVYGDTDGKITATSTSNGNAIGVALEAASADGAVIEVAHKLQESV